MLQSPRGRGIALVGTLVLLFGLLVWAGTLEPAPSAGSFPGPDWYGENPTRFLGERVDGTGHVVGTDPVRVAFEYGVGETVTITLEGVDHAVSEGRRIRVFGVLTAPDRIDVVESFTTPPNGMPYAYVVSFLAGLWALYRILRTWSVDREVVGLVPRWGDDDA
jgi:hypothetical protein